MLVTVVLVFMLLRLSWWVSGCFDHSMELFVSCSTLMTGIAVLRSWVLSSLLSPRPGVIFAGLELHCGCGTVVLAAGSVTWLPVVVFLPFHGPFPLDPWPETSGADGSVSRQEDESRGLPQVSPVLWEFGVHGDKMPGILEQRQLWGAVAVQWAFSFTLLLHLVEEVAVWHQFASFSWSWDGVFPLLVVVYPCARQWTRTDSVLLDIVVVLSSKRTRLWDIRAPLWTLKMSFPG